MYIYVYECMYARSCRLLALRLDYGRFMVLDSLDSNTGEGREAQPPSPRIMARFAT